MKNTIIMASAGLVSLGLATSAIAVDTGKWYMKAGGGYTFGSKTEYNYKTGTGAGVDAANTAATAATAVKLDADKSSNGGNFEVGVGYNMTESFRGDVAFTYYMLKNKPGKNGSNTTSSATGDEYKQNFYLDTRSMRFIANAYYDINTNTNFTPFITAGLGIDVTKADVKLLNAYGTATAGTTIDGTTIAAAGTGGFKRWYSTSTNDMTKTAGIDKVSGKNKTNFAYQMGVGMAYKFSEGMYFDLAYRFENLEKVKDFKDAYFASQVAAASATTATYTEYTALETKRTWKNSINAGLRFEF